MTVRMGGGIEKLKNDKNLFFSSDAFWSNFVALLFFIAAMKLKNERQTFFLDGKIFDFFDGAIFCSNLGFICR